MGSHCPSIAHTAGLVVLGIAELQLRLQLATAQPHAPCDISHWQVGFASGMIMTRMSTS